MLKDSFGKDDAQTQVEELFAKSNIDELVKLFIFELIKKENVKQESDLIEIKNKLENYLYEGFSTMNVNPPKEKSFEGSKDEAFKKAMLLLGEEIDKFVKQKSKTREVLPNWYMKKETIAYLQKEFELSEVQAEVFYNEYEKNKKGELKKTRNNY